MYHPTLLARIVAIALLATAAAAQDKITVSVQRGTVTRTAVIEAAPAADAMKALDFLIATTCSAPGTCEYTNETDAIRKNLVAWFVQQLTITPGTVIKSANDSAIAAQKALDKAKLDYSAAAQSAPVQ